MSALIHLDELSGEEKAYKDWIRNRFEGECTYCGKTPRFMTIDHVIPRPNGDRWHHSNLVPACSRCNNSKGDKNVWEWWKRQRFWCKERGDRLRAVLNEQP